MKNHVFEIDAEAKRPEGQVKFHPPCKICGYTRRHRLHRGGSGSAKAVHLTKIPCTTCNGQGHFTVRVEDLQKLQAKAQ